MKIEQSKLYLKNGDLYVYHMSLDQVDACRHYGGEYDDLSATLVYRSFKLPEMEFNEFEPRLKSAKTRFKFSAGLNLETFNTILSRGLNLNRRSNSLNSATDSQDILIIDKCRID